MREQLKKVEGFLKSHQFVILFLLASFFVVAVLTAGLYADMVVVDRSDDGVATGRGVMSLRHTFLRYDAVMYARIAEQGYQNPTDPAFFPGYPLIIRTVSFLVGSTFVAAIVVSWASLIGALIFLFKWTKFELSKLDVSLSPWWVVGGVLLFPTSFYLGIGYTESLSMLVTVAALYSFRKEHYLVATVCTIAASSIKVQGTLLVVFFAADYMLSNRKDHRKIVPILFGGFGALGYMVYQWHQFGTPFYFLEAQKYWGRLSDGYIVGLIQSLRPLYIWYLGVLVTGFYALWKYLPKQYFVYSLVFIALPISSGSFESFNRYMLSMVPMFLALAILVKKKLGQKVLLTLLGSSIFLLGWSILLFANGYWVA